MSDTDLIQPRRLGWHFLNTDGRTNNGGITPVPGETLTIDTAGKKVSLCNWGLHYCPYALDALWYARGFVVERVEDVGDEREGPDDEGKVATNRRRCLWIAKGRAKKAVVLFAADAAERAMRYACEPADQRFAALVSAIAAVRSAAEGQPVSPYELHEVYNDAFKSASNISAPNGAHYAARSVLSAMYAAYPTFGNFLSQGAANAARWARLAHAATATNEDGCDENGRGGQETAWQRQALETRVLALAPKGYSEDAPTTSTTTTPATARARPAGGRPCLKT